MDNCPDYSYLNTMMTGRKPCPTLTMKMDTAAVEKLATSTLRKVDTVTSWIGDKKEPREEDASRVSRKLSAMQDADYAMMTRTRAATGSPTTETIEPMESNKEDVEVGSTELPPRRAAAAKLSPRAAAAKLSAKRTKLPPSRQAASRLGLGYKCGHDDCSPQMMCCSPQMMRCSPDVHCSPQMYEMYGCPEMTAAAENHERFDTMSPLLPPVEDYFEEFYKVFRASSNLTTLQPGPWNISSLVQRCQAAPHSDSSSNVEPGLSCRLLLCSVESCRKLSVDCKPATIRHPELQASPGQVCQVSGPRRTRRGPWSAGAATPGSRGPRPGPGTRAASVSAHIVQYMH